MWQMFLVGFAAGFAATPHCLGMCGGFPLYLAKGPGRPGTILRLLAFVTGKGFTYVFLGALGAAAGTVLLKDTPLADSANYLRLTAGVITIVLGLTMLGLKLPNVKWLQWTRFISRIIGRLPEKHTVMTAFTLGLGVGFLPCALPMGMLAVAVTSNDILKGMLLMAGVGLGTAPGLLTVGILGNTMNRRLGRIGMQAAGFVVIIVGIMTIIRISGMTVNNTPIPPSCCEQHQR